MWRCFGLEHCYTKNSKKWWLRANGLWDPRLDAIAAPDGAAAAPRRAGRRTAIAEPNATRVLAAAPELVSELAREGRFIHLHRLLHNLLTLAALLGRVAALPELPCSFYRRASLQMEARRRRVPHLNARAAASRSTMCSSWAAARRARAAASSTRAASRAGRSSTPLTPRIPRRAPAPPPPPACGMPRRPARRSPR